jgi:TIR domain
MKPGKTELRASARQKDAAVFISYAHEDAKHVKDLLKHLRPLVDGHGFQVWHDQKIRPGTAWHDEIRLRMREARVAVLLVSADFLNSDFVVREELPVLVQAAEQGEMTLIWIAVSASNYTHTPLATLQAATDPTRPLDTLPVAERAEVWVRIAEHIGSAVLGREVETMHSGVPAIERDSSKATPSPQPITQAVASDGGFAFGKLNISGDARFTTINRTKG